MSTTTMPDDVPVTAREAYFFDLNGFIILRNVLTPEHLTELNTILDNIKQLQPPLAPGEWYGGVHAHSYGGAEGICDLENG